MAIPGGLLAWCVTHLAIGAIGTWTARRYATRRRLIDHPGERRSHVVATPRGGGIAIALSALFALGSLAWARAMPMPVIACIAAGLVLVAGIGWIDDHRPLSPWLRLAVQFIAAVLVAIAVQVDGRGAFAAAFGAAVVLLLVNVWNFMDGIDGLAASQGFIVAGAWAWLAWPAPAGWLLVAVAMACLGFLPFNFPRARIFLGDVGSGSLGYLLAVGLLWLPPDALHWPWLAWLPLSAFVVDATLTLWLRMLRGERWWTPHLQHAYQRWTLHLGRHLPVTSAYALWTACAAIFILFARGAAMAEGAAALGFGYAAAAVAWTWMKRHRKAPEGGTQA